MPDPSVGASAPTSRVRAAYGRVPDWAAPVVWFAFLGVCCLLPLWSATILRTLGPSDLANHVAHAYQYGLALKEHQLPPLVAPTLNGNERIPVFQYYSGTGYLIPGVLSALGLDVYVALKLALWLHLLAGGFFSYLVCRRLGILRAPAIVAGTAFELFPFIGIDLLTRGAYPEAMAATAMPLLLYCVVRIVQARGRQPVLVAVCLTAAVWAYVIAIHPIQAVLGSALVVVLGSVYAVFDLRDRPLRARAFGSGAILAAAVLAGVGTIWFWWPIARDNGSLRIVDYQQFGDAGLNHLAVILWPGYRETDGVAGWAPQLGLHFAVAAVVVLILAAARRLGALAATSALILVAIVIVIRWHAGIPLADDVFKPLQWTYRLLLPAALVGMLCVAFVLDAIERTQPTWRRGLAAGLVTAYVLSLGIPYFADRGTTYETFGSSQVENPGYVSLNADFYGLRGSDYRKLGLDQGGALLVATDIGLIADGVPYHVHIVVRPPAKGATLAALVDGQPSTTASSRVIDGGRELVVDVGIHPTVNGEPFGNRVLRFQPSVATGTWRLVDLSFHPDGDAGASPVRLPAAITTAGGGSTVWHVAVPSGKAGLYQLPFLHLPSGTQFVDGRETPQASIDRFLTIVPLHAGENTVRLETRPSALALPGLLVLLAAVIGALGARFVRWRPARLR